MDDLGKRISFNKAWKDFLIMRAIPYNLRFIIYFDSNNKVTRIDVETLKEIDIEGQQYFCDESTIPSLPLVYPKNVVLSEVESKIVRPFLGKQLEGTKIAMWRGKSQTIRKRIEAQLGRSARSEIQKAIQDKNYWEALFSLHQILEHRFRKMLLYKSSHIDLSSEEILIDEYKEKFCQKIKNFKQLAKLAFLVGAIEKETSEKVIRFDSQRDNIAHKLLRMKIPDHALENLCLLGLELMDTLEKCFSEIVKKPKFLEMGKFEIITL